MALGGGTWRFPNKVLLGAYINVISKERPILSFADRGYAAVPLELDWGADGEVFTISATEFLKNTKKYFGYDYAHEKLKPLRDLFTNLQTGHFYRVNSGGEKAKCDICTALYSGVRGNDITMVVSASVDNENAFTVKTYIDTTTLVDSQTVLKAEELKANDFVTFNIGLVLKATAGTSLTGGTNGTTTADSYQAFLDKIEKKYFNVMVCPSSEEEIKKLFVTYTKRMRDDVGIKFQLVAHQVTTADSEGIISVYNTPKDNGAGVADLVYWVGGTSASAAIGFSGGDTYISLTNKLYNGEYTVNTDLRQSEIEKQHSLGQFVFHEVGKRVGGEYVQYVRVLEDINTFVSFTPAKNKDFSLNQIIRTLDQVAIDIATIFNESYLGKVQNDLIGQASLKSSIIAHHRELERIRAIQNFNPDEVIVSKGTEKGDVLVDDVIEPVGTMTRLYMTVLVA